MHARVPKGREIECDVALPYGSLHYDLLESFTKKCKRLDGKMWKKTKFHIRGNEMVRLLIIYIINPQSNYMA